ncbi:hypothetical protein DOY81_004128 [Sarcophaga bullata]|nr:hypothetical protein DOY81_004128 [Sarcophaga bullata]
MEQIEYTRTVVPSSMRSPYWKYFGFPSDNGNNILTRQKVVCTLCNTAIAYNKNTSNLRTHLMSKHVEVFHGIIMPSLNGTSDLQREKKFDETIEEESYLSDPIAVIQYKRLCSESQESKSLHLECDANSFSQGFLIIPESNINLNESSKVGAGDDTSEDLQVRNCNYMNFDDDIENGPELVEVVEASDEEINQSNLYDNKNEEALHSMETMLADMVQTDLLTLDILKSQGFCTYNQQTTGIRIDDKLIERVLEVIRKRFDKTQQLINAHVAHLSYTEPFSLSVEVYEDTGNDNVLNVYYNYLNEDKTALLSVLYMSSTISSINTKISDHLLDINLKNCTGIVVPCLEDVHEYILDFATCYELPLVECLESVLTFCLRKIYESCELSVYFKNIMHDKIKQNSPRSNCYWSKLDILENLLRDLTEHELEHWQELKKCLDYLKPLKMALDVLSDERLPSCTLIRPVIVKLYEENISRSKYASLTDKMLLVQRILQKELYEKIIKQDFLKEATFFDPRFHRNYAIPDSFCDFNHLKSQVIKRFKVALNVTETKEFENIKTKEISNRFKTNSGKCSSLKMFFKRDSCTINAKLIQETNTDLDKEFERYQMEESLDLDQSPALWWQQVTSNYKQLSKIAKYYLTIPSCCMPSLYRLDVEQRYFILNRRKCLSQLCQAEKIVYY